MGNRGRPKKATAADLVIETEEDKKFYSFLERQKRLAKKYKQFEHMPSIDPNYENTIYIVSGERGET